MTILLLSLFLFLLLGVPIAYSLGLSALCYFLTHEPGLIVVMPQQLMAGMDSYPLIALPLFIFMGQLMNASGITGRLIDYCMLIVGRFRGGLGIVNISSSMLFGGISGSSTSDTASIGSILIPEMKRRGYPHQFAAGLTVASSTMGMIIPPSIPMVLFAITAQESVGKLFLGGVIPGLMVGVFQIIFTLWISTKRNYPKGNTKFKFSIFLKETFRSSYILLLPIFVVGTVVLGIATATESAGLGVFYAIATGCIVTRKLTLDKFINALRYSILTSAKIMIIIAFSKLFIWILAYERLPDDLAYSVEGFDLSLFWLLILMILIILLAGTFIDVSPAILLLTPIFLPIIISAGGSPILFGVILVIGLAVGACTPPVGNCLNVCSAVSGLRIGIIFRGALPFLVANVLTLLLIVIFPSLVLWLPSLLMD
ncbi:MAG: C4-dicarboxylate ABC transporter [Verrucomicrobiales bacterium]|nr:C4-dicarboxylate ABC transporter [Verrucomicrobiales bacterium]